MKPVVGNHSRKTIWPSDLAWKGGTRVWQGVIIERPLSELDKDAAAERAAIAAERQRIKQKGWVEKEN